MKLLFTFFTLSFALMVAAQPTYNSSDYADAGDMFLLSSATFNPFATNFGATGANFNWDYSNLNISSQQNREILDPGDTGYFVTFFTSCLFGGNNPFSCTQMWNDLTDIAEQDLESVMLGQIELSNVVRLMRKTTTTLEETILGVTVGNGGFAIPLAIKYTGTDVIYSFPLDYNDAYNSSYLWDFDLNDVGQDLIFKSSQIRSSTVEGWGSLTTPYTTFPSVLKIKSVIQNMDTLITNGVVLPIPSTEVEYTWLDPNYGYPVLKASGNEVFGNDIITSVEFLDTLRCLSPNPFFFAQPIVATIDQTTMNAEVTFNNLSTNADSYNWDFGDNTMSTDPSPVHAYTEAGLYTVQLEACNTSCTTPECAMFTFVVLVNDPVVSTFDINDFWGIQFYPNPVEDYFNIEITDRDLVGKTGVIEITDVQGKQILRRTQHLGQDNRVDLPYAPTGVYFVRLTIGELTVDGKLVKMRGY